MGFSEPSSEGRRREIRILGRVLVGASVAAVVMHLSSAPLVVRMVSGLFSDLDVESVDEPIEVIVVDEEIPEIEEEDITPPPPDEEATETEPAASAAEDSAPPLRTSESAIPTPPVAESIDTVPTESVIASDEGIEGGEGGEGSAETIGLISGDGTTEGDVTAPVGLPNVASSEPEPPFVNRQPVQEVARARPPAARLVSCAPCSSPDYPLAERREQIQGQPVINVIFDQDGNVVEAVIERPSGNDAFDQAALEEAKQNWRFQDPYGLGGQVSVEVVFVIEGSDQFDVATEAGAREAVELPVQQSIVPVNPTTTGTAPAPEMPETLPATPEPEVDSSETPTVDEMESEEPASPTNATPDATSSETTPETTDDRDASPTEEETAPSREPEVENISPGEERDLAPATPAVESPGVSTPMSAPEPAPAVSEPATPVPDVETTPGTVPQVSPESVREPVPESTAEPTEE